MMDKLLAYWGILKKDMQNYYLKPPQHKLGNHLPCIVDADVFHTVGAGGGHQVATSWSDGSFCVVRDDLDAVGDHHI